MGCCHAKNLKCEDGLGNRHRALKKVLDKGYSTHPTEESGKRPMVLGKAVGEDLQESKVSVTGNSRKGLLYSGGNCSVPWNYMHSRKCT